MEELMRLWNAMTEEYGEDAVRNLADECNIDISSIGEGQPEDWAHELFVELLSFLVDDLAQIDGQRAMLVISKAGVSDETMEDLFS